MGNVQIVHSKLQNYWHSACKSAKVFCFCFNKRLFTIIGEASCCVFLTSATPSYFTRFLETLKVDSLHF